MGFSARVPLFRRPELALLSGENCESGPTKAPYSRARFGGYFFGQDWPFSCACRRKKGMPAIWRAKASVESDFWGGPRWFSSRSSIALFCTFSHFFAFWATKISPKLPDTPRYGRAPKNRWKSLKNVENRWKTLKNVANRWKSMKIVENRRKSMPFTRFLIENRWFFDPRPLPTRPGAQNRYFLIDF